MKRAMTFSSTLAASMFATIALAQSGIQQPYLVSPATLGDSYTRPLAEASPSDQAAPFVPSQVGTFTQTSFDDTEPAKEPAAKSNCGCNQEPACGCEEASCGCEPSCGCDNGCSCGCDDGCCLFGDCCLGDAWTIKSCLAPLLRSQLRRLARRRLLRRQRAALVRSGRRLRLPRLSGPRQSRPGLALCREGGRRPAAARLDWGYRGDILYGVDAQKTQAYGNNSGSWDNSFDNGVYGWAIPQAYAEVAYGDWSVKVGHFFTIIGYEVVPDVGNFFYSHSYTMFNSEPFTHTGILATYCGQRRHHGLRRLDLGLGHRFRSVRRRQQLVGRHQRHTFDGQCDR